MSEGVTEEYWAARDADGWEWVFNGEPTYDGVIWDPEEKWRDMATGVTKTIACSGVPPSHKRKLALLDLVKGTVEYEGEAIHG